MKSVKLPFRRILSRMNCSNFLILSILLLATGYLVQQMLANPTGRRAGLSGVKTPCLSLRDQPLLWIWTCKDGGRCVKVQTTSSSNLTVMSQAVCKLTCNRHSSAIWPKPSAHSDLTKDVVSFRADEISFAKIASPDSHQVDKMLEEAKDTFLDLVKSMEFNKWIDSCSSAVNHHYKIDITMIVSNMDKVKLNLQTDESYSLHIKTKESSRSMKVHIKAPTFFGARHALETLSQLMVWDDLIGSLVIVKEANVEDRPVFPHRGLSVDSARSFIEIPVMKRIIDGLSYNKMNVLHWHLTDSQSFPFVSVREPLMSLYGAYSPEKVYRPEDIEELVHYALVRGVKIIPELDGPSHVGAGWTWGPEHLNGEMVLCHGKEPFINYCFEPPCGILNPINENVYKVLGNIYKDMRELFQSDVFHVGGDEVKFGCWGENSAIVSFMKDRGWNTSSRYHQLWSYFHNRSLMELDKAYAGQEIPTVVLWSSDLTANGQARTYLDPKRYIVQFWGNSGDGNFKTLIQQGYRLIISNVDALYLDCGFHSWMRSSGGNNWCSPYKTWQQIYENSPRKMVVEHMKLPYDKHGHQILGGEVAMWTEQTDGASIEVKIWPRTSALAERLWSDPSTSWTEAVSRLSVQRNRMIQRGLIADAIQMEFCDQQDSVC